MITKTQQYLLSKLPAKLLKNIEVISSGCWLWKVNINAGGYGRISICINSNKKRIAAHIYIYKLLKGEYEEDLKLDHVYCKHRNCCNPTHLSPVTNAVNVNRGSGSVYKKLPVPKPVIEDTYLSDLLDQYPHISKQVPYQV